ncbi:MAG: ribosome biogenesis GTPase Der [Armatimonadetes bacterium]|nr:ribosome biogenesis GTPase Der [Armatimonadota bacterium]
MALPIVAIVGRTNVGKSSLFNRLAGRKLAVVEDFPGVTRDRVYSQAELDRRMVILVDTGGIVGGEGDELFAKVKDQAARALREADVIIMMVDGQEGPTDLDHEVADIVRRSGKPYVLAANKMEKTSLDSEDFLSLRLGLPVNISAIHGRGLLDLVEDVEALLPPEEEPESQREGELAVAIIGKPNVGKSALTNAILGEERVIVSEMPGTTRDAVDTPFEYRGEPWRLVDTAGLRRRGKRKDTEFYSSLRTLHALSRSQVALCVFDAFEGPSAGDARVAGEAHEAGRALVLVANKWDLLKQYAQPTEDFPDLKPSKAEKMLKSDLERLLRDEMPFASYAPLVFTSAQTGEGIEELLAVTRRVADNFQRRIETGPLNRLLRQAVTRHAPPTRKGRQLKVLYGTQVRTGPPTFALFVNDPTLMHLTYERYLVNCLRREYDFEGTPLRLLVRARRREKEGG